MAKYVKSPLNYTGGKYKLLEQILPLSPSGIKTFVDLFGGGFDVGANVSAEKIIYNDKQRQVSELLQCLYKSDTEVFLSEIDSLIEEYNLTRQNLDGFNRLRDEYNRGRQNPAMFYTLILFSFDNFIRFNRKDEFNQSFGRNRSDFNPILRQRFIEFVKAIKEKKCEFFAVPFDEFDFSFLTAKDFVYCDPPYLKAQANYNTGCGGYTENDERKLLDVLDRLNERKIRFAVSNNLKFDNPLLAEFKEKYNVHCLKRDYSHCNHTKKDRSIDIEALITNY